VEKRKKMRFSLKKVDFLGNMAHFQRFFGQERAVRMLRFFLCHDAIAAVCRFRKEIGQDGSA